MKIFNELNENKNLALALGYFDGVHKGHQAVIKSAVDYAKEQNKKSAVITFKDHPCCYFWGVCPKYILTREHRREKLEELGIDYIYELDFESISKFSAQDYLKNVLVKNFEPISISTGFNHNFGLNKSGDTIFLNKLSKEYGYKYFMLEPQKVGDEIISSTAIRNLLSSGDIRTANNMLGYNFSVKGKVVEGKKLGRKIGFKTANLIYPKELIDVPFGVYSTLVVINSKIYRGITNFGVRPTVSDTNYQSLETHILDFDEDIYGENITVTFFDMIRKEVKFNSMDELKTQIEKDIIKSMSISAI